MIYVLNNTYIDIHIMQFDFARISKDNVTAIIENSDVHTAWNFIDAIVHSKLKYLINKESILKIMRKKLIDELIAKDSYETIWFTPRENRKPYKEYHRPYLTEWFELHDKDLAAVVTKYNRQVHDMHQEAKHEILGNLVDSLSVAELFEVIQLLKPFKTHNTVLINYLYDYKTPLSITTDDEVILRNWLFKNVERYVKLVAIPAIGEGLNELYAEFQNIDNEITHRFLNSLTPKQYDEIVEYHFTFESDLQSDVDKDMQELEDMLRRV